MMEPQVNAAIDPTIVMLLHMLAISWGIAGLIVVGAFIAHPVRKKRTKDGETE